MYEVDQYRDAYREGLFARALGLSCDVNPYPEHSREAFLWIHGWWLIQDEVEIARDRGQGLVDLGTCPPPGGELPEQPGG